MCTLSLLPRPQGGYLLAMTRDERRSRGIASPPQPGTSAGRRFLAPRDADAGGSWIAVDESGRALCLLNGDLQAPGWQEKPQLQSRGELLLELVGCPDLAALGEELADRAAMRRLAVRPFQLVVVERDGARATRWQFDGVDLSVEEARLPWIVTSNGFDPRGVALARAEQFAAWRERQGRELSSAGAVPWAALLELHRSHVGNADDGQLASFCLHRPLVSSVSVTVVEAGAEQIAMRYQPGPPCLRAPLHEVCLPCN